MRRCPTCRADSPKLVHFGIYLCPTCGPIDADGRAVAPPPGVLLTPASEPRVYESLAGAAPTPVADDTQPNPIAFPPPVPLAPPRPMPLELAPPRPTPLPGAPSPFPAPADPLTVVPPPSDVSRTSFAPPPPRDPRDLITTGRGPPRILVVTLALFTVISFLPLAAASRSDAPVQACSVIAQIVGSLAILSGRRWARTLSLFTNGLGLLFLVIGALLPLPGAFRALLAVDVVMTGFWIYVLLRRDVVDYCRQ